MRQSKLLSIGMIAALMLGSASTSLARSDRDGSCQKAASESQVNQGSDGASTRGPAIKGIDPTGNLDSTKGLQAAIDNARGTLALPPGRYRTSTLTLSNSNLKLLGRGAVLEYFADEQSKSPIIKIAKGVHDLSVEGITIDAETFRSAAKINGIESQGGTSNVKICGATIKGVPRNSIFLTNGDSNWEVAYNEITNSGMFGILVGYLTEPVTNLYIHHNKVSGSGEGPISFIAANGSGKDPSDKPSAGVKNARIEWNLVADNGQGISGYSPANERISVTHNTIQSSGKPGVQGHAAHWGGRDIRIEYNKIIGVELSAVFISAWPNGHPIQSGTFVVAHNSIEDVKRDATGHGVQVDNATGGVIEDNTIRGVGGLGVSIKQPKSQDRANGGIAVKGNFIDGLRCARTETARPAILIDGADDSGVKNNTIKNSCGPAVAKR